MRKIFNFLLPDEETVKRINIYTFSNNSNFTYLTSNAPLKSADMIFLPVSEIHLFSKFIEFKFIPFMLYGDIKFIEKSFILGSCDFLKKPWTFNELETRASRYINNDKICVNNTVISYSNSTISSEFKEIPLTVNEYMILSILTNNMDKIISRESIYYRLGIVNQSSRVIDVYLNSIRSKLKMLAPENELDIIRTVRGKGYTINSQFNCG